MKFPRGAERDYINAIGIAAVFVAERDNERIIRASRDLEASARTLNACMVEAWWVKDRDTAQRLARAARRAGSITAAAASAAVKLTSHDVVMKRVSVAAKRVNEALKAANGRGELQWFNRAYRDYRLSGRRAMSFGEARARLRRAMIRRLVLVEGVVFGPELVNEVFGEVINNDLGAMPPKPD